METIWHICGESRLFHPCLKDLDGKALLFLPMGDVGLFHRLRHQRMSERESPRSP